MNSSDIAYEIKVITPKTWTNDNRGKFFEDFIASLLKAKNFKVTTRIAFTGSEIDVLAEQEIDKARAFCECKLQQELIASDIIYKLIGKAIQKKVDYAILFSLSDLGKQAKGVLDEIERDDSKVNGLRSFKFYGTDEIIQHYISALGTPKIHNLSTKPIKTITLVLSPHPGNFWVVQDVLNGLPNNAYLIPTTKDITYDAMKEILRENDLYQGLNFVYAGDNISYDDRNNQNISMDDEYISKPPVADSVDDYRPCRPEDFVGRHEIQKSFWQHLDKVRNKKTDIRILAVIGQSGYGKSSIALRLANRFRNNKWSNKFYLFPVDVRTAKSPLFVAKALLQSLNAMIQDEFIKQNGLKPTVENIESLLSGASIKEILSLLQLNNKILVLFFDQFEELFSREELFGTFDKFLRLANEVNAIQSNIVLAFSWRTGISMSDNNPAYFMWHKTRDIRTDFNILEFTSTESSQLITQFEKHHKQKLINPLRRRLLEQSQGKPWLLKKLCIHVFKGLNADTSQEKLLETNLNIKELFDDDLSSLSAIELKCLKFIAKLAPLDVNEILDKFDNKVLQSLEERRLLTKTGSKYTIYWDIFKEYLQSEKIPSIPTTYVPISELGMITSALRLIASGCNTKICLMEKMKYKLKTVTNLISDLKHMLLIKNSTNQLMISEDIQNLETSQIANHLFKQLSEHIITQGLYDEILPGEIVTYEHLDKVIEKAYSTVKLSTRTINIYSKKMVTWLLFSGLLETDGKELYRPHGKGKNFAEENLISLHKRSANNNYSLFLASSGPKQSIVLLTKLKISTIKRQEIEEQGQRNTVYDLVGLKLAKWNGDSLEFAADNSLTPLELVVKSALSSKFLTLASTMLTSDSSIDPRELGRRISEKLGRQWSEGSCIRYGNAAKTWISDLHLIDKQLGFFSG